MKRKLNESPEAYKQRRKLEKAKIDKKLSGKLFWNSTINGQYIKEPKT